MDFFTILGTAVAIYFVGRVILAHIGRQLIDQDIKEEIAERIRVIKIEQHEQLMLAYDQENGEFLTQGLTAQEIEQNVVQRFPNRIFIFGTHVFSAKGTITNEFSTN